MPIRRRGIRRTSGRRYVLVIEPRAEFREDLVETLAAEGYQPIGTDSMREGCSVLRALRVRVVLVNLSGFSAAAIFALGHEVSNRPEVRLLLVVATLSGNQRTSDLIAARTRAEGAIEVTHDTQLIRIAGPELLNFISRNSRPN
jgi:hypothetical protein